MKYKLQLKPGAWLAEGMGACPYVLTEDNARIFDSKSDALDALREARAFMKTADPFCFFPFKNAVIEEVK